MIKCRMSTLVVMFLLFVPCLVFALPGPHDPATGGNGFLCNDCHVSPASFGDTAANFSTNVCLRCHGTSTRKTNKAFIREDFADIDNTNAALRGAPYNTSHKWLGTAINSNAKAVAAIDPNTTQGLNKLMIKGAGTGGTLSCVRCHSVHGTAGTQSNTSPYLRYVNDKDQLCMNCHLPRKQSNTLLGSHPVNVTYTSARVKAKASEYYLVNGSPRKNLVNPTAEMKNKSGYVVCSSCHKVHVADSDSSTWDNYSTSNGFNGGLNPSDGSLLRVSKFGADNANTTVNICTNCHTKGHGTNQHNAPTSGSTIQIQCMDCHNAHVDVIAATDAVQTPNKYLLRRYVNYSGVSKNVKQLSSYRKRLVYTDYTTTAKWAVANGTGVCQACHALPNSVSEHTNYSLTRNNCISCHQNAPHADSAPISGCTGCHGQPPVSLATTAGGYSTFSESATPHATHAGGTQYNYSCDECHKGNTHNSGNTYSDVFISKTGILAGTSAAYSSPNCSSVYCHSDGKGNYAAAISWNGTKGSLIGQAGECTACHLNTTIATGSHAKHIATMGYGCVKCHAGTVSDNTTVLSAAKGVNGTHVNGVKDLQFSNLSTAKTSCATVYCHSNGKGTYSSPTLTDWANKTNGGCGSCHKTATTTPALATGSHTTHFTQIGTGDSSCTSCHTYNGETSAPHVNGTVDLKSNATSCGTCHADPYSATAPTPPTWGTSASGCAACHNGSGAFAADGSPATGSHARHMALSGALCNQCHTGATKNVSGGSSHLDGDIDVTNGYPANVAKHTAGSGYSTCSTSTCHGSSSPTWGANTSNSLCTKCHGTGTTAVITSANRNLVAPTGVHQSHLLYTKGFSNFSTIDYRCQTCHGALPTSGTHANGTAVPAFQGLARMGSYSTSYNSGTCSVYCHNPAGTKGTLNSANAGTGVNPLWSNASYLSGNANPKTDLNCNKCHKSPGNGSFTSSADHSTLTIASDCASCHGHNGGTGGSVGQRHMDGVLYGNGACDMCHGYPPMTQDQLAARTGGAFANAKLEDYSGGGGHHSVHLLSSITAADKFTPCLPCHPDTSHNQGSGTVIRANVDISVSAADATYRFDSARTKRYNATTMSCSNISCHFQPTEPWMTPPIY